MSTTLETIQRQIAENPILLYMKVALKISLCNVTAGRVAHFLYEEVIV